MCTSPNIIRLIKSKRIIWVGHVVRMEEMRYAYKLLCSAWKKWISGTPLEHPPCSPDLSPCDFWALPTMKRELRGKKFRSDQRSAAHFRETDGAL
jgi:hypothetical protein